MKATVALVAAFLGCIATIALKPSLVSLERIPTDILSWREMFGFLRRKKKQFALIFIALKLWKRQRVQKRQARDATSEWGRYARNPGARGRALFSLLAWVTITGWLPSKLAPRGRRGALLQRSGEQLTTGLLQLGPLYIKLGQIVSCRPNLLPAEWMTALERLQDRVPAQSGEKAWELAEQAWTSASTSSSSAPETSSFRDTFQDFDDVPLAAASLGQVHKARLRDTGAAVAIKLQRPYLREMYDQDFALLTKMVTAMDRMGSAAVGGLQQNWTQLLSETQAILYREIDYTDEAENAVQFADQFGLGIGGVAVTPIIQSQDGKPLTSAAPWLRTPYVYRNLSTPYVLVQEYVPSIKVTNTTLLDQAGVIPGDTEYLADCLGRAYLRQFGRHFFFHTDPHPGNIGVEVLDANATAHNERVRLVFYDFGQATTLQPKQGDGIMEIIEAIVDKDVDRSIESFQKMGVLQADADLEQVRKKIAENYRTGKIKANQKRLSKRGYQPKGPRREQTGDGTEGTVSDSEVMKYFRLPAEYAFVGRALSQMDGVGKSLDPEFDFISAAAPWMYEIKGAGKYLQEEADKRLSKLRDSNPILELIERFDQWQEDMLGV